MGHRHEQLTCLVLVLVDPELVLEGLPDSANCVTKASHGQHMQHLPSKIHNHCRQLKDTAIVAKTTLQSKASKQTQKQKNKNSQCAIRVCVASSCVSSWISTMPNNTTRHENTILVLVGPIYICASQA